MLASPSPSHPNLIIAVSLDTIQLHSLHANYPTCWRYVVQDDANLTAKINSINNNVNTNLNNNSNTNSNSTNATNGTPKPRCLRELWVFNYNPGVAFNVHVDEKDSDLPNKQQHQISFDSLIQFLSSKMVDILIVKYQIYYYYI